MPNVKYGMCAGLLLALLFTCLNTYTYAANSDRPVTGHVTGRSIGAGLLSFIIWPGIGQAVNSNKGPKVATHAVLGLIPITRFWSGYDALVDRHGGYWNGKI
jgi:hypothetical protein